MNADFHRSANVGFLFDCFLGYGRKKSTSRGKARPRSLPNLHPRQETVFDRDNRPEAN